MTVCIMVIIFGGFTSFSKSQPIYSSFIRNYLLTSIAHIVHKFDTSSFITTYFPIPFFAVLFFGYKFWNKTKIVKYEDLDFVTGCSIDIPDEVCVPIDRVLK